ncbi:flavin monoamine oxidase family protein [Phenylobacterium montanum]|uniref:FAD-dependent oxidoreductase n=1 Tax=Phenylobacterium montanum TaxID=2823693 RepID=A0A975G375_9CAUL|nr:NAD(P)/FAD-dependent oxidoreductase [Caulobacter sp. S6]QUD90305.1 FAD-dependent oxidoreductase [Caulobacter sp. S6]
MSSKDRVTRNNVSRRLFMGQAAMTTAGAGLLAAPAVAAETTGAHKARRARQTDYDVIVVGGGFSGVTASRDLQKNGLKTLLLEAKSRLGGRTFDTQFRGHHIELGGTWVHWTQPAVWSEITRYGMAVEETPGAVPEQAVVVDGAGRTAFEVTSRIEEIATGVGAYFAEAATVWDRPYDSKHCWAQIASRDAMTAADRLKAVSLTPLQRGFVVPVVESMAHCPIDQASYVEMMRWYALGLNSWGVTLDAVARYKLIDGTGALARRIAADGKVEIRLGSSVRRIEQVRDGVIVTPRSGKPVTARAVVLALPPRVLKTIEFAPALSDGKLAASRSGYTPSGIKVYAEVKGRLGKVQWAASGTQGPGTFFTYKELDNSTLIVGFSPRADAFDGNDEAAVQAVLRQFDPNLEVLGCTSYAWGKDPFALGTFSGFAPGGMTKYFDELARPEGRIYMAGGDVGDNGWRNFIDGAIARGAIIARQVSEVLI